MEKRIYFDSERNYFGSIAVGDFFTGSDPTYGNAYIYMRIEAVIQEERILCNVVNLETGVTSIWSDNDEVYPVKTAGIEVKM